MATHNNLKNSTTAAQHLPLEIIAVPQNDISPVLTAYTEEVPTPVNVKVRIRNKQEIPAEPGVTSDPKLLINRSKNLRLVSSDQTIISFDLLVKADNVKKVPKKPHYRILQLFKPGRCLNIQNDEDNNYPYVPSTQNDMNRIQSTYHANDKERNETFEEKFTLKKSTALRTPPVFLGTCKPGGCLDPPFSEDKYIYKPKDKILPLQYKITDSQTLIDKIKLKDTVSNSKVIDNLDDSLQSQASECSIGENNSHSLITYPPHLTSSEIHFKDKNINKKKAKSRTPSENKVRISINEFSETYFMPPKKQIRKITDTPDINFQNAQRKGLSSYAIKIDPSLETVDETCNYSLEQKVLTYNNEKEIKVECSKTSENLSLQTYNSHSLKSKYSISEASIVDINFEDIMSATNTNSLSHVQTDLKTSLITKDQIPEAKISVNIFENNLDSLDSSHLAPLTTADEWLSAIDFTSTEEKSCTSIKATNSLLREVIDDKAIDKCLTLNKTQCEMQPLIGNQDVMRNSLCSDETIVKIASLKLLHEDHGTISMDNSYQSRETSDLQSTILLQTRVSKDIVPSVHGTEDQNDKKDIFQAEDTDIIINSKYNEALIVGQRLHTLSKDISANIFRSEPKPNEKNTNNAVADLKSRSYDTRVSENIDCIKESQVLEFEQGFSSKLQSDSKNNEDHIHDSFKINSSLDLLHRSGLPEDSSKNYTTKDKGLNNTIPIEYPHLNISNVTLDHLTNKIDQFNEEKDYIVKDDKENIKYFDLNGSRKSLILIENKVQQKGREVFDTMSISEDFLNPPETYSKKIFNSNPGMVNIEPITKTQNSLMAISEANDFKNKKSSIQINLGFYTSVNDRNETTIKTFDPFKNGIMHSHDQITIIKSIVRKNDSEIRIPINSESDLTFKIKQANNLKTNNEPYSEDKIDKSTKQTLSKDNLLQDTLNSVYENLIPVQKIIQTSKQEADLLTRHQSSFMDMLHSVKPVKIARTSNKCTCYNYLI